MSKQPPRKRDVRRKLLDEIVTQQERLIERAVNNEMADDPQLATVNRNLKVVRHDLKLTRQRIQKKSTLIKNLTRQLDIARTAIEALELELKRHESREKGLKDERTKVTDRVRQQIETEIRNNVGISRTSQSSRSSFLS